MTETEHPEVPWRQLPDLPPGHIGWRMGPGEDVLRTWWEWASATAAEERRAHLLRQRPIPDRWMEWAAELYAHPDDDDEAIDAAYEALAAGPTAPTE